MVGNKQKHESGLDRELFSRFLEVALERACVHDEVGYASYSWTVEEGNAFDFLKKFYSRDGECFYFEHPVSKEAIVSWGVLIEEKLEGKNRFESAKMFSLEQFSRIYSNRKGTTCLLTSFSFEDKCESSTFPAGRIYLPKIQVRQKGDEVHCVINVKVAPGGCVDELMKETEGNLKIFENNKDFGEDIRINSVMRKSEVGGEAWHERMVSQGIERIKSGEFRKVVLARAVDLVGEEAYDPVKTIGGLREKFPDCFSLLVNNGKGQTFLAAAPERLLRIDGGVLHTEALAGSAKRGATKDEDKIYGDELLSSDKDLREHRFVIDHIVGHLESLGIIVGDWPRPGLKKLANVQHIVTPIQARVDARFHLLDVAQRLHPTPAVGGVPVDDALRGIQDLENFERGLYAGVIGWVDAQGNGELAVGLRSALIDGNRARLYAGGGIVEGSDPKKERIETDIKIEAMLMNLKS